MCFFFSSRRRHTRSKRDWSSDVCSSDLLISRRMSDSLEPNNSSANTLESSVFPTPVGPTNKKEPIGRYLDLSPARLRRIALAMRSEERRVGKEGKVQMGPAANMK